MRFSVQSLHILVIEDNPGDFILIEDFLLEEIAQPNIQQAETFLKAKSFLQKGASFDIILLDLTLPDATGEKLVIEILRLALHIPIIVLTGFTDKAFGIKTLSLGISDYLLKDELNASVLYKSIAYSIERKRINNQLKDSEKKYQNLFDFSSMPMLVMDLKTLYFLDVNQATTQLYGYSKEEFLTMNARDIRQKEDMPLLEKELDNIMNSPYFKGYFRHRKKNGQIIEVEIQGNVIDFGGRRARLVLIKDITESKRAEEKLKQLSLVASETTDVIQISDNEGKLIWLNKASYKLDGFSIEEVLGRNPAFINRGQNTNLESVERIEKVIRARSSLNETILNYTKNGREYWFNISISPVFDEKGNCINFIGVGRDVSEAVKKRDELQHLLDVTAEQNKRLLNFAHIVSHNIRSHASNLSMIVDFMESSEDLTEKYSYFEMLKDSVNKLMETIENLNEIIKIQNNTNLTKTSVNLKLEIEKTEKALNSIIKETNTIIELDVPEDLIIKTIPAYLDSIILNLLTNAIKYRFSERAPHIKIKVEKIKDYSILFVQDNGIGIDLDRHGHKLFGMYKTFHDNADAKGIGLFITKNQVEAMGGKIEVESEVGKGSIFKIYLNEKN